MEVTDWFADGVIDYLTTYGYGYDERGNRLSTREESESGGRPLGGRTRTFEYDQHNNLVREFEEVFTSRGVTSRWWGRYEY